VLRARPAPRPPAGTTVTIRVHAAGTPAGEPAGDRAVAGSPTVGAITTASGLTADGDASDAHRPASAPGVPGGPGEALVDAVGAVLAGQLAVGTERLTALADDPDVPLAIAAGARLASLVATALTGRPVSGEQEDLAELVELVDMPWLAALALAAGGLAGGAAAERAVDVALEREAHGDPWGTLAARLCAGLGILLAGGRPVAELDDVVVRAARLDATVLECWARAWLATALSRSGDGQAAVVAAEAERLAARAEVPGAEVWALTVRAQLAGGDEGAGLAARAESIRRQWAVDVPVPALADAPVHPADVAGEASAADMTPRPERPATGPGLRVRCLGGFRLELDGKPVDVAAVKPRARAALHLLAAYGGRPVHTETLVDALWPDMDAAAGKRNVQVAVSSLRRLLDDHRPGASALVRREGQAYALALPDVSCSDVAVFAAACAEVRAAARASNGDAVLDAGDRALVAYGGDLLPEEGPADWAVELRRSLAADATGVALTVADQAIGLGYFDVAAIACARGLEIDRYHDGLWRLLIDAQARGGDVAAAARTQDRYNEVLRELGLDADTSVDVLASAPASDQALA
jgi:DNA-binding SARP family transcriptional activator